MFGIGLVGFTYSVSDRTYSSVQTGITITGSAAGNYIDRHIVVVIYKI